MQVMGIISSRGGTGKSVISSNLAATMTKMGYSVLLIEADFVAPNLQYLLDMEVTGTWNDFLNNTSDMDDIIHSIDIGDSTSLDIIPTKTDDSEILNLLNSPSKWQDYSDRIVDALAILRKHYDYDYIIFDNQSGRFLSTITHSFFCDYLICVLRPDITNIKDTLTYLELYKSQTYFIWNQLLDTNDMNSFINTWTVKFQELDHFAGNLGSIPFDQKAAHQKWVEQEIIISDTELNRQLEKIAEKLISLDK